MNNKKIGLRLLALIALPFISLADLYEFTDTLDQKAQIDVDYWAGSGTNETILIIDWNEYYTEGDRAWKSPSHAFGYRWNGDQYESEMLLNIAKTGLLTYNHDGGFILDLLYKDSDGDQHCHEELGSWNLASTGDLTKKWGDLSSDWQKLGDWDANTGAVTSELLVDGQLEGINLMYWFNPEFRENYQYLDIPGVVPEPASALLFGVGSFGILMYRRRKKWLDAR